MCSRGSSTMVGVEVEEDSNLGGQKRGTEVGSPRCGAGQGCCNPEEGGWKFGSPGARLPAPKGSNESPLYSTEHAWDAEHDGGVATVHSSEPSVPAHTPFPCSEVHLPTVVEEIPSRRVCASVAARLGDHVDAEGKDVLFTTMAVMCWLNRSVVNLKELALHIPHGNVTYCPLGLTKLKGVLKKREVHKAKLIIRLKDANGNQRGVGVTVFANGAVQIHGTRSYRECERVLRKLVMRLRRTGGAHGSKVVEYPQRLDLDEDRGLALSMVMVQYELEIGLRMDEVYKLLVSRFPVSYDTEVTPGISVNPTPQATVVVYHTGKVNVTLSGGGQRPSMDVRQEMQSAYQAVCGVIWDNLGICANMMLSGKKRR